MALKFLLKYHQKVPGGGGGGEGGGGGDGGGGGEATLSTQLGKPAVHTPVAATRHPQYDGGLDVSVQPGLPFLSTVQNATAMLVIAWHH